MAMMVASDLKGPAAVAERLGGIVYTGDPKHMTWLRDAGARITVAPVPF